MILCQNEKIRLDRFLSANLNISRSQIAQLIAKNLIQINGKVAHKSGILLKNNDKIHIAKMADSLESSFESSEFLGDSHKFLAPKRDIEIARIYEDDDFLVLNKPPFLATHGAPSLKEESLVEWLKARKIQLSSISGEKREGIIHRLDKQTSGAIVVAKNNRAHRLLSAQLADKSMGRIYLAIIDTPLKADLEVECYLARNPKNRLKISKVANLDSRISESWRESLGDSHKIPRGARYSKSKFFKLLTSKDGKKELICARLFTGRTHQIRAHLESINRHIVGDELYGYRGEMREMRVMLHSYLLYLTHPHDFSDSCGNSSLDKHSADFGIFGASQTPSLVSAPKIPKSSESHTENPSVVLNANDSKDSSLQDSQDSPPKHANLVAKNPNVKIPKMLFLAPLFDDMQSFLEQHFDIGEVNEILRKLPSRFDF